MARPYSQDLRERVKRAIEAGQTQAAVAERFQIGIATVERYVARWRKTGSVAPAKVGGHKPHKLAEHADTVTALVAAEPDQTLDAVLDHLAGQGIKASRSALHRFLTAAGLHYKKNPLRRGAEAPGRGRGPRRLAPNATGP